MPANKTNFLVLYEGCSQVYGAGSEKIALASPPPSGYSIEDKHILFVTYEPDNSVLSVHEIPKDKVEEADIVYPKTWKEERVENEKKKSKKG